MVASRFNRNAAKTSRARRLRESATFPERLLWSRLRQGQVDGASFRRQHPAGPYVLDFYCSLFGIAVEVDGDSHGHFNGARRDVKRDAWLRSNGVIVERAAPGTPTCPPPFRGRDSTGSSRSTSNRGKAGGGASRG